MGELFGRADSGGEEGLRVHCFNGDWLGVLAALTLFVLFVAMLVFAVFALALMPFVFHLARLALALTGLTLIVLFVFRISVRPFALAVMLPLGVLHVVLPLLRLPWGPVAFLAVPTLSRLPAFGLSLGALGLILMLLVFVCHDFLLRGRSAFRPPLSNQCETFIRGMILSITFQS